MVTNEIRRMVQTDDDFDFKVATRLNGEYRMLHWYEYNDGNHLVIGKTDKQVVDAWRVIFKRERGGPQPKKYYKATIVLPPTWVIEGYRIWAYDMELSYFKAMALRTAAASLEHLKKLPPGWSRCKGYAPKPDEDEEQGEEDPDTTEWATEAHYECANCDGEGGLKYDGDYEQLYIERRRAWRPKHRPHQLAHRGVSYKALASGYAESPDEPLYYTKYSPGHHSSGMTLAQVKREDVENGYIFQGPIAFFCHLEEATTPTAVTDLVKNFHEERKREALEEKARRATEENRFVKTVREDCELLFGK